MAHFWTWVIAWKRCRKPTAPRLGPNGYEAMATKVRETARLDEKLIELKASRAKTASRRLVAEFLPAVPYDYMSAKPLGYRLKAEGSYVLYSVGEDGNDDGGDPTAPPGHPNGLWTGRDAVWPSPAN